MQTSKIKKASSKKKPQIICVCQQEVVSIGFGVMENGYGSPRTEKFPAGLRVLVVDDDPTWLKILEKMLKKCSYEGIIPFLLVNSYEGCPLNCVSFVHVLAKNDTMQFFMVLFSNIIISTIYFFCRKHQFFTFMYIS